ncbi:predicted protein [Phaeodactylum tricornutum CCAP 1055/1]|uniref:Uncharacterized protein n=2 Tax=Phaeodactylum tricornutum TaxID=2850 RepID=B7FUA0_PHATC|nr:predicted protein [Phaeodactylum tricornutum CCAP 1055/1]EEC49950.1 predicted protein [Phaeodactylum tricornutum CCAP 1055/1]|eukprot:XP_002178285.1 predicted protein [Phaeodactylum tricornutum CCAP 1055/1]
MLSNSIRISSLRTASCAYKAITSRSFGIGDTFGKKEKVEEDRFMREQEKKFFEQKKAEMDEKMHATELAAFEASVAPAMAEAENALSKTGDKISVAGLEAIAKWKLGL